MIGKDEESGRAAHLQDHGAEQRDVGLGAPVQRLPGVGEDGVGVSIDAGNKRCAEDWCPCASQHGGRHEERLELIETRGELAEEEN